MLILCRNVTKGGAAVNTIKADLGKSAKVDVVQCDLSSMKSIRACAERILNGEPTYFKSNFIFYQIICFIRGVSH